MIAWQVLLSGDVLWHPEQLQSTMYIVMTGSVRISVHRLQEINMRWTENSVRRRGPRKVDADELVAVSEVEKPGSLLGYQDPGKLLTPMTYGARASHRTTCFTIERAELQAVLKAHEMDAGFLRGILANAAWESMANSRRCLPQDSALVSESSSGGGGGGSGGGGGGGGAGGARRRSMLASIDGLRKRCSCLSGASSATAAEHARMIAALENARRADGYKAPHPSELVNAAWRNMHGVWGEEDDLEELLSGESFVTKRAARAKRERDSGSGGGGGGGGDGGDRGGGGGEGGGGTELSAQLAALTAAVASLQRQMSDLTQQVATNGSSQVNGGAPTAAEPTSLPPPSALPDPLRSTSPASHAILTSAARARDPMSA